MKFSFFEFFAGAGMARAGLGDSWRCVLANDIDAKKGASYAANWGDEGLRIDDVGRLTAFDLPGHVHLAWCSFPCQDISLAGERDGLGGLRSGAFWPWWRLMQALRAEGRAPKTIVIENVTGLLSSRGGSDFRAICDALADAGYRYGALEIDAALFVPQSRERMFIIAVDNDVRIPAHLLTDKPGLGRLSPFHPPSLVLACDPLPDPLRRPRDPLWFKLPTPPVRNTTLADVLEDDDAVEWDTRAETNRLIGKMGPRHLAKLDGLKLSGERMVRSLNRRTRPIHPTKDRRRVSRWEIRDDAVANPVRTGGGGSSTQQMMIVHGDSVRTRRITPREEARLMGLSDSYVLPVGLGDGHDLVGDGVVVPVVRFLAEHILEPILIANEINPRIEEAEAQMDTHHSGYPRNEHDFYIEDDWTFDALIAVMGRADFEAGIYDPCCGIGTILSAAQRFKLRGMGSDIVDHRPKDGPFKLAFKFAGLRNFLTQGTRPGVWPSMVFNPPYRQAQAFIEKALHEVRAGGGVAALLPASFRYSLARYAFFQRREIERIISISRGRRCLTAMRSSRGL